MLRDLGPKLGDEWDERFESMLFEQRLRICQESEYAGGRGMRAGDHCRGCTVCRLRVRVHTHASPVYTRLLPKLRLRSSQSRLSVPISYERHPNKCLSLPSFVALPGVQLPAQPAPSLSTLLPKIGPQNAKPSYITLKVRYVLLHPPKPRIHPISPQAPPTSGVRSASTAVFPRASGILPVPKTALS